MSISEKFELPKFFFELQVIYSSQENLQDFILELEELDILTLNDLANFSFVIGENEVTERAIFFLSISSLEKLKLLFIESKLISHIEENEITQQLLNGTYMNECFWKALENKEYSNDNFNENGVDFFFKFVKKNTTVDNILDKVNKRGFNNLLEPEIEILDSLNKEKNFSSLINELIN